MGTSRNILVTGGTGYIGSRLARTLAVCGHHVRVFGLPDQGIRSSVASNLEVISGSILDSTDVNSAIRGSDVVFHLAACARSWARHPSTFFRVNALGTDLLLSAALRHAVQKVVVVSTNLTFGPSGGPPPSFRGTLDWYTDYQRSKLVAEHIASTYVRRGLNVVIVNPTRVFGPGMLTESNGVTRMIKLYLEGKWRFLPGSGHAIANYVFVEDVVQGFIRAMESGRSGHRYILGGQNLSYVDLFRLIARAARRPYRLFPLPASVAITFSLLEQLRAAAHLGQPTITPGWIRTYLADWIQSSRKAEQELGYRSTPVDLAIQKTVIWLRALEFGVVDDDWGKI